MYLFYLAHAFNFNDYFAIVNSYLLKISLVRLIYFY